MTPAAAPFLVLDQGHGPAPFQAWCGWCGWRSRWRPTARKTQAEHARHLAAEYPPSPTAPLSRRSGRR